MNEMISILKFKNNIWFYKIFDRFDDNQSFLCFFVLLPMILSFN